MEAASHAARGNENVQRSQQAVCASVPVCLVSAVSPPWCSGVCDDHLLFPLHRGFPSLLQQCAKMSLQLSKNYHLGHLIVYVCFPVLALEAGHSCPCSWMAGGRHLCGRDVTNCYCQKHVKWRECCLSQGRKQLDLEKRYKHLPLLPFLSVVASHFFPFCLSL